MPSVTQQKSDANDQFLEPPHDNNDERQDRQLCHISANPHPDLFSAHEPSLVLHLLLLICIFPIYSASLPWSQPHLLVTSTPPASSDSGGSMCSQVQKHKDGRKRSSVPPDLPEPPAAKVDHHSVPPSNMQVKVQGRLLWKQEGRRFGRFPSQASSLLNHLELHIKAFIRPAPVPGCRKGPGGQVAPGGQPPCRHLHPHPPAQTLHRGEGACHLQGGLGGRGLSHAQ